jgi:hypothetical protein
MDVREGREVRRLDFVGGPGLNRRADSMTKYALKAEPSISQYDMEGMYLFPRFRPLQPMRRIFHIRRG